MLQSLMASRISYLVILAAWVAALWWGLLGEAMCSAAINIGPELSKAQLWAEAKSRFEFRIALPQTGRFADLKVGEALAFGFDPARATCFPAAGSPGA